jgi:uncharacterized membrane protein
MDWPTALPAMAAAFAAALVEIVEAFTIILVVATLRGWRPALLGTAAALALLGAATLVFGPLIGRIPIEVLQLVIGVLLLLFGMGWLRKAALRAAGVIPLHDEAAIFARETSDIAAETKGHADTANWIAGIAAFKAVLLEGLEVVFIVIAIGAGNNMLWPASLGALAATVLVLCVGAFLHKPLTRVPENALKFGVGVMLSAFGLFWTGEGLGIDWPGGDAILFAFAALFLVTGLAAARLRRGSEASA